MTGLRRGGHVPPHPRFSGPEWLVGVGFRCWMAGYQTGDIACWEHAWDVFAADLGAERARVAVTDLGCWVRRIRDATHRTIETFPAGCRGFCRDECLAVAMVAASQHTACPALRACAFALLGSSDIDAVARETQAFAQTLARLDRRLTPQTLSVASPSAGGDIAPPTPARH